MLMVCTARLDQKATPCPNTHSSSSWLPVTADMEYAPLSLPSPSSAQPVRGRRSIILYSNPDVVNTTACSSLASALRSVATSAFRNLDVLEINTLTADHASNELTKVLVIPPRTGSGFPDYEDNAILDNYLRAGGVVVVAGTYTPSFASGMTDATGSQDALASREMLSLLLVGTSWPALSAMNSSWPAAWSPACQQQADSNPMGWTLSYAAARCCAPTAVAAAGAQAALNSSQAGFRSGLWPSDLPLYPGTQALSNCSWAVNKGHPIYTVADARGARQSIVQAWSVGDGKLFYAGHDWSAAPEDSAWAAVLATIISAAYSGYGGGAQACLSACHVTDASATRLLVLRVHAFWCWRIWQCIPSPFTHREFA